MAEPADAQNHRTAGDTSDILYQVRTLGLSPGVIPESAIDALQKQFRVSQKKAQNLLNNRIVCKPTHNERARALKRKLFKLGVRARVEEVGGALSQDKDSRTTAPARLLIDAIEPPTNAIVPDANYLKQSRIAGLAAIVAPVLYATLIIGLVAGAWWYVDWVPLPSRELRNLWAIAVFFIFIPPLLMVTLALILVAPLFKKVQHPRRIELKRRDAPLLFDLVKQLSAAIEVPEPTAVYLNNDVNASVSSANGTKGLRQGNLELTIGAPLLFSLTGAELASIVAHEFGHFTQRREILRSYRIRRVAGWLSVCAYQPRSWEQKMHRFVTESDAPSWDIYSGAVKWAAKFFLQALYGSRLVFAKLADLNDHLTGSMSRQMEFNADDHAVSVLGSQAYVDSEYRLHELLAVEAWINRLNWDAYQQDRLLRDIPKAIADKFSELTLEQKEKIHASVAEETKEFWSTHPATKDRITRALSLNVSSPTTPEFPARDLIIESAGLGERATTHQYAHDWHLSNLEEYLTDNDRIFQLGNAQARENDAFKTFFGEGFANRVPLFSETVSGDDIKHSQRNTTATEAAHPETDKIWAQKKQRMSNLFMAGVFADSGASLANGSWDIADHSRDALDEAYVTEMKQLAAIQNRLLNSDRLKQQEIVEALHQLETGSKNWGLQLLDWLCRLAVFEPQLEELRRYRDALCTLNSLDWEQLDPDLASTLQRKRQLFAVEAMKISTNFSGSVGALAQPLENAEKNARTTDFLQSWNALPLPLPRNPKTDPLNYEEFAANLLHLQNAIAFLTNRALAQLAELCTREERANLTEAAA